MICHITTSVVNELSIFVGRGYWKGFLFGDDKRKHPFVSIEAILASLLGLGLKDDDGGKPTVMMQRTSERRTWNDG